MGHSGRAGWLGVSALLCALLTAPGPGLAGDYTAIEVGSSGEILENSALHQPKHYLRDDADLNQRVCTLLADMDALLLALHAAPAQLADNPAVQYPADAELGELFSLALENNPELTPMRTKLGALAARTRFEGAKMDPMLGLELDDLNSPLPVLRQSRDLRVRVMLSQEFESYGKRGLRREIAHMDELKKELELKQKELDLLLELTEAYYDLFGSRARLRALEQNIKLMGVLIELANRKYSAGHTPLAAVMAAQVEQTEMEAMRIELQNLIRQQEVRVEGLLGRPAGFKADCLRFDAIYPLPTSIEWDNPQLLQELLACRPDYQLLELSADQQDLRLELAERDYRPDYTLSASYSVSPMGQDMLMAGVEVPLFTHKEERQDAMLQEAQAERAMVDDEREALENMLLSELETFQHELNMHAQLVELYRKGLVPQSRLALDSNIAAYSANMMDLSDLIMSQQSMLTQQQELEQNYIHILHTLTDLQVMSCGVFDPAPYMLPDPEAGAMNGLSQPFDLANQAIAESTRIPAPRFRTLDGEDQPPHIDASPGDSDGGFIDELKLPPGPRPQPEPDVKAEPEPAVQEAKPLDPFYQPFEPGKDKDTDAEGADREAEPESESDAAQPEHAAGTEGEAETTGGSTDG
ncbi:TolC family protein [bacterium]|nr:TolC family protein [bacterium]